MLLRIHDCISIAADSISCSCNSCSVVRAFALYASDSFLSTNGRGGVDSAAMLKAGSSRDTRCSLDKAGSCCVDRGRGIMGCEL